MQQLGSRPRTLPIELHPEKIGISGFTFELFFLFNFDHDLVQVQVFRGLIANADDLSTKDWQLYLDGQKIEFGINLQDDGWQTLQHQDDVSRCKYFTLSCWYRDWETDRKSVV